MGEFRVVKVDGVVKKNDSGLAAVFYKMIIKIAEIKKPMMLPQITSDR